MTILTVQPVCFETFLKIYGFFKKVFTKDVSGNNSPNELNAPLQIPASILNG